MIKSNLKNIFADEPEVLRILEAQEQTALLREIASKKTIEIPGITMMKGDKGDSPTDEHLIRLITPLIPEPIPGENGYTPIKGVDYFDGIPGKNGEDGKTPAKKELLNLIIPLIPKVKNGEDGKSVSVDEVINGIKSLKGKEAEEFGKKLGAMIDISFLRNAQTFMYNGKRYKIEELMHGGGSSSSTSSGYQVPTGTVNGVNTVFVFTTEPNAIVVDGVSINKTSSDGTVNWTGTTTITLTVAPNFNIYATA